MGWMDCDNQISEEDRLTWSQQVCYHDWIPIMLLTSTVYDCRKCKIKKEDYEDYEKNKKR
jgi:hypothetical protein